MFVQCFQMMLLVSSGKNTTMYTGVQCFYSSIKLKLPQKNISGDGKHNLCCLLKSLKSQYATPYP